MVGNYRVSPKLVYCIDTSSLIRGGRERYPFHAFPSLWAAIEALVDQGRMIAPTEVLGELKTNHRESYEWAVQRRKMFVPIDGHQTNTLAQMAAAFPPLSNPTLSLA